MTCNRAERRASSSSRFRFFSGTVGGLGAGGHHHQGHAEQLRQRLQEILRRLWAANRGSQFVHEESGPDLVAGLRAGARSGRKDFASGSGQDQGADERAVESSLSGCLSRPPLPLPTPIKNKEFDHEEISRLEHVRGPGAREHRRLRRRRLRQDHCDRPSAISGDRLSTGDAMSAPRRCWSRPSPRSSTFRLSRKSMGNWADAQAAPATARPT